MTRNATLFDLADHRTPLPERVMVFASGVNQKAEIDGFAKLQIPIGVSVARLDQDALKRLITLQAPLMVDSGAFSELPSSKRKGVCRSISHLEWERRLAIYLVIASALHEQALLVAPDKVGDQAETLRRLDRYRNWLRRVSATGARLLIPLQVGVLSHIAFYKTAQQTAGVPLIPAMPLRKAATSAESLLRFVSEVKPKYLHLLGMGIDHPRAVPLIQAVRYYCPDAFITMDSNRLRAVVGQDRPLTRAERELRSSEVENVFGEVISPVFSANEDILDYTDKVAFPSLWADSEHLHRIADLADLSDRERALFLSSPDDFLQGPWRGCEELSWIEHPLVEQALDDVWKTHVEQLCRRGVRQAAIASIFNTSRLRGQTSVLLP